MLNDNIDTWSKWDLHLHSPRSNEEKNDFCGDRTCEYGIEYNKNISKWVEDIIKKWQDNHITLVSVTDHNVIDGELFEIIKQKIPDSITLIPGIEIDAYFSDATGIPSDNYIQLIAHINPKDLPKLTFRGSENRWINHWKDFYTAKKEKKQQLTVDDVVEFFIAKKISCNFSVEGEKSRGIFSKRAEKEAPGIKKNILTLFNWGFLASLNDSSPDSIIQSKKKWRKWLEDLNNKIIEGDLQNISHFLASDNHCPSIYPLSHHDNKDDGADKISFFNGRNNFTGLCLSLKSKGYKIKAHAPSDTNSERQVKFVKLKSKNGTWEKIELSKRLNVIIGSRSSGKTLFLKLLSIYHGSTHENSKKYKKLVLKSRDIELINFEEKLMVRNTDDIREFEQGCFIDSLLKKEPPTLVNLLDLQYPTADFKCVDEGLSLIHRFYLNYKEFLGVFFSLTGNTKNIFKDFKDLNEREFSWYTNFSNRLAENFADPDSFLKGFEEKILSAKNTIIELISNLEAYKKSLAEYNFYVEQKNLTSIFPRKMIFKQEDFREENISLNAEIANLYSKISVQINKRLAVLKKVNLDYTDKTKSNLRGYEEKLLARDKNYERIKNLFSELGEKLRNNPKKKIIIPRSYKVESKYPIPKSTYDILPTRIYELSGEGKESFTRIIAAPLKNLIREKENFLAVDPKDYFDSDFIKKTFIDDKRQKLDKDKIFVQDCFEKDYVEFRNKIFTTRSQSIIKQEGKKVEDNSPGKIAQIYFDIATFNLLGSANWPIVLFDQPEDSIDQRYIATEMTRKVKRLLEEDKQILIVTHNPNLVINTSPDNIIIPFMDERKEINYAHGRLEDKIRINDQEKMALEWVSDYVEGGKKSFLERLLHYEIGWSENGR